MDIKDDWNYTEYKDYYYTVLMNKVVNTLFYTLKIVNNKGFEKIVKFSKTPSKDYIEYIINNIITNNMTNLEKVKQAIHNSNVLGNPPKGIVISHRFERDIFTNGELSKAKTLEEEIGIQVILDDTPEFKDIVRVIV